MPTVSVFAQRLSFLLALLAGWGVSAVSVRADPIWRCGNEYTNTRPAPSRGCVPVTQAPVTVIEGTRVQSGGSDTATVSTDVRVRVEPSQQRQRDQDARAVLQVELDRAREQHQRLLSERQALAQASGTTASGERLNQLREALQRNEADMAGLQREIARLSGGKP